jgi:hypothetical protein
MANTNKKSLQNLVRKMQRHFGTSRHVGNNSNKTDLKYRVRMQTAVRLIDVHDSIKFNIIALSTANKILEKPAGDICPTSEVLPLAFN